MKFPTPNANWNLAMIKTFLCISILLFLCFTCKDNENSDDVSSACEEYGEKIFECMEVERAEIDDVIQICKSSDSKNEDFICAFECDRNESCQIWSGCVQICSASISAE